jgi:ribosome recycling factor
MASKEKETQKDTPDSANESVGEATQGTIQEIETHSPQAQIAGKLAAAISPAIAREIISGNISFAALTVIVDDKFSCTFPFSQLPTTKASEQEVEVIKLNNAKATMLAALEFSRTAGLFKSRSMRFFEDGYFETLGNK